MLMWTDYYYLDQLYSGESTVSAFLLNVQDAGCQTLRPHTAR